MVTLPSDYYNGFNRANKYKNILFKPKPSQSSEMNELQSLTRNEYGKLVESLYGDGRIFKGGRCFFTPGFKNKTSILCGSAASLDDEDYFTLDTPTNAYYVWFTVDGSGTDPSVVGRTSIVVALLSSDNNSEVATKLATELDLKTDLVSTNFINKTTVENFDEGVVSPAADFGTGFTFTTTQEGTDREASLEETLFFYDNVTNDIDEVDNLSISDTETVVVGIALKDSLVTSTEDPDLLNQAVGTANEGLEGASRLKIEGYWKKEPDVTGDEVFFPIHEFENGELITPTILNPQIETTTNLVQDYDRESNGNYVVEGFSVSYITDIDTGGDPGVDTHLMDVSLGLAHVEGVRIKYPYSRQFYIDRVSSFATESNEPITFTGDGWYSLRLSPFKDIQEVNGTKNTIESVTRGGGSTDTLTNTPVYAVSSITQGATTYTTPDDYLVSGNDIDWSPPGNEPAPSSSYDVDYDYGGLDTITDPDDLDRDNNQIYVEGFKNGTLVFIDYTYYLNRVDRATLLRDGEVKVIKGEPAYNNPNPPILGDGISLATVKVYFDQDPEIETTPNKNFLKKDIQSMDETIRALQYNVARLVALNDSKSNDPTTIFINTFTDPFIDDDSRDAGKPQNALIAEGLLVPNYDLETEVFTLDELFYQLEFEEELIINQYRFSRSRKVNAYQWQSPPPIVSTVTPNPYSFITKEIIKTTIEDIVTGEERGKTWHPGWRYPDAQWYKTVKSTTNVLQDNVKEFKSIVDVPNIDLNFTAKKFQPNEQVSITFDGGELTGPFYADSFGVVNETITVPAGTKNGSRRIVAKGLEKNQQGSVNWLSIPFIREVKQVVTNLIVRVLEDPVAEVFNIPSDRFITTVSIQVSKLPLEYLDIFILPTVVGFPDRNNGIARKRIFREDLTESVDSQNSAERTIEWNNFTFDAPVFFKGGVEYAIVVSTPDAVCKVRIVRLGELELTNNEWQTTQALSNGLLLESSTGSSWDPINSDDLTFRTYAAKYNQSPLIGGLYTREITFGTLDVTDCTDIFLSTTFEVLPNTDVKYYAEQLDLSPTVKNEILPFSYFEFDTYTGRIKFTCKLTSSDTNVSPTISGNIAVAYGNVILPATYITRGIDIENVTHMNCNLDMYEPVAFKNNIYWYTPTTTYFTFNTTVQGDVGVSEVTEITCLAGSKLLGGEHFLFSSTTTDYYAYFIVDGKGLNPNDHEDIDYSSKTGVSVSILSNDTNVEVAQALAAALDALSDFTASNASEVVTLTVVATGSVTDTIDGEGWRALKRLSSKELGNDFQDVTFTSAESSSDDLLDTLTSVSLKIILDSDDVTKRPSAAKFRMYTYNPV